DFGAADQSAIRPTTRSYDRLTYATGGDAGVAFAFPTGDLLAVVKRLPAASTCSRSPWITLSGTASRTSCLSLIVISYHPKKSRCDGGAFTKPPPPVAASPAGGILVAPPSRSQYRSVRRLMPVISG